MGKRKPPSNTPSPRSPRPGRSASAGRENQLLFASASEWDAWLAANYDSNDAVWLKIAKRGSDVPSVSYQEALECAICYGWIDGQKAPLDDRFWLQRFSARKPGGRWSRINREKAERLTAEGRMKPAGLRQVEAAKSNGNWDTAYSPQSTAAVPEDLQAALDADPRAKVFFETLNRVNRYAILYRIGNAKKPETRSRRIEQFVKMLNEGKKIHE